MITEDLVIFWFRRDLRLEDNTGLWHALKSGNKVLPVFIYDKNILNKLEPDDARVTFLTDTISELNRVLSKRGSGLVTIYETPLNAFKKLISKFIVKAVYANSDYEPTSLKRDREVKTFLEIKGIPLFTFKDNVIFEKSEITKEDGKPYTIYTPYSVKWLKRFDTAMIREVPSISLLKNLVSLPDKNLLTPGQMGFRKSRIKVRPWNLTESHITKYHLIRDIPSQEGTSMLGPHLRFGTVSIREVMRKTYGFNLTFTKELIWREFFMQILFHFPHVEEKSFRAPYDRILWVNNEEHFEKWCTGTTGFPIIDAGMRELSQTGYMHNRVRMITANFLTRHLLTDWRWGEAWFASKLLDYELSSNNGNWQWAAGSGCDAAQYFRVFNPTFQQKKFDPGFIYIKRWIPEFGTAEYPEPVVDQRNAREKAILYYRNSINTAD